ncbi:MAG: phage holin family protein [Gammaproteobacteria bacterium]|nr:phage holin family protein [Gammaproteobacteria bacterium]
MAWPPLLSCIACTILALRLFLYRRVGAAHRPLASFTAYAVIVAAGSVPLLTLLGRADLAGIPQAALNAVLCLSVFAVRGNIVELFRPSSGPEGWLTRIMRKNTWRS